MLGRVRIGILILLLMTGCENAPPPCSGDDCPESCGPGIDAPANEGHLHVTPGTKVDYGANPPTSGSHWPYWRTPWDMYTTQVPREKWVHNLEHGGIVLLYNCPTGCPD